MDTGLIVVLCDDYMDATVAYGVFVAVLGGEGSSEIRRCYPLCNMVDTMDDLRYIFIEHTARRAFERRTPDIIEANSFFDDIMDYYALDEYYDYVS